ncbi:MAG: hypothetical protein H0V70_29925 [Ktedonobacteraceae bacterium]|nr:hypothetical protein [Ktedonobacteraceae bacterium]
MQIYHILPTVPLTTTTKETLLQHVARSLTEWRRTAIVHLPTQLLPPDQLEILDAAEQAYVDTFTIQATEWTLAHG